MKRIAALFLAMILLLMAGCGQSGATQTETATNTIGTPTPEQAAPFEATTPVGEANDEQSKAIGEIEQWAERVAFAASYSETVTYQSGMCEQSDFIWLLLYDALYTKALAENPELSGEVAISPQEMGNAYYQYFSSGALPRTETLEEFSTIRYENGTYYLLGSDAGDVSFSFEAEFFTQAEDGLWLLSGKAVETSDADGATTTRDCTMRIKQNQPPDEGFQIYYLDMGPQK